MPSKITITSEYYSNEATNGTIEEEKQVNLNARSDIK